MYKIKDIVKEKFRFIIREYTYVVLHKKGNGILFVKRTKVKNEYYLFRRYL